MIIAIFFALLRVQSQFQTYENGTYKEFNIDINPNFECWKNYKSIGQIIFKGTFASPPQIIISMLSYKYELLSKFSFSILTTTTTYWTFSIQCFNSNYKLQKYEFSWIAVNNNRIYVINDYMNSTELITGFKSQNYNFPDSKASYYVACQIVSFLGYDHQGCSIGLVPNGFYLQITQGVSGLGVQIIVGQSNCFFYQDAHFIYNWVQNLIFVFDSPSSLPILNQYFKYEHSFIELNYKFYQLENGSLAINQTGGKQHFSIGKDGSGYVHFYSYAYNSSAASNYPYYFKKMRVAKQFCKDIFTYSQKLQILELSNQLFQDNNYVYLSNLQTLTLHVIYQYKCQPQKKLIANILQLQNEKQPSTNFTQYCHKGINLMTFYLILDSGQLDISDLNITLSQEGLLIQQKIIATQITYTVVNITNMNK